MKALRALPLIVLLCSGCHSYAGHHYKDDPKLTPLMNAAAQNDLSRVHTLLAQGADVKVRTAEGQTALYEAIERRDLNADNLPIVDALLEAGADPNEVEFSTSHPLSVSLTRDYANPAVTLRLLQRGARVPQECPPQNVEDSLVSLATQESSIDVIRELIVRGSPVNCQFRGATALYWAALNGQYDRAALLLDSGADPRQRDLDAANTTNSDSRVEADSAKTRQLLKETLKAKEPKTR
jgi:ankyrin repeat protein